VQVLAERSGLLGTFYIGGRNIYESKKGGGCVKIGNTYKCN
jgi:hypothetical protein